MGRYALSISLFAILACTASAVVTTWKTTEEICDAYGTQVCALHTSDDSGTGTVHYQPKDACEALDGCLSYSTSTCSRNASHYTTWNSLSSHFGDVAGESTVDNECTSKTTEATCPSGTCFWDETDSTCTGSLDSCTTTMVRWPPAAPKKYFLCFPYQNDESPPSPYVLT